MASEKISAMIEEIKALTVLELNELVKTIEEELAFLLLLVLSSLLAALLLLLLKKRPSSTLSWLKSATLRPLLSRLLKRSPVWA